MPEAQKISVLVIEDEPEIRMFLAAALASNGFNPAFAITGREGLTHLKSRVPEILILDLGLPDMDGHAVLQKLREFSAVPVIILSARDREAEKIAALDAGADDYVEKPFGLGGLLARIRTALRHKGQPEAAGQILEFDGLVIDQNAANATLHGAPLALTRREYALLLLLARNPGRVLTHRQILMALWGPAHTADVAYLRVYIGQLRKKLGPELSARLSTEPGVGYRLTE